MADVQIAIIDQENTQIALSVPGIQGPTGATGDVAVAQDGTAALPGIRFEGDTNTGIYRPGADQLAISTGGTGRLFVASDGGVGIGASPATAFHVVGSTPELRIESTISSGGNIRCINGSGQMSFGMSGAATNTFFIYDRTNNQQAYEYTGGASGLHVWNTNGTERARIDSSGRLLVGTSTDSGGALFQVNGDRIRVATSKTPASATAAGAAGEICWDANYIYVCIAANTWKRTAIATW